jgi:hypothetical protein
MPRLVEFDHVHRCLQSLLMTSGRKWLHVVESNQDTNIKELVLGNPKIAEDGLLGCEGECGVRAREIKGNNELVHTGI